MTGRIPWARLIRRTLKGVKTDYVLMLLDDFFLRAPVGESRLHEILQCMVTNKSAHVLLTDAAGTQSALSVSRIGGARPPGSLSVFVAGRAVAYRLSLEPATGSREPLAVRNLGQPPVSTHPRSPLCRRKRGVSQPALSLITRERADWFEGDG